MPGSPQNTAPRVVVLADLVGYSKLAREATDLAGADGVAALELRIRQIFEEALHESQAEPIGRKGTGDGAILIFEDAAPAERFAVALHRATFREGSLRRRGERCRQAPGGGIPGAAEGGERIR